MKKAYLILVLAVFLPLLASCGKNAFNGIPEYPDSKKADVDFFTSRLMPAPPWASPDGLSYSGGPFAGCKIDKSEYILVKDPSNPGLKKFYNTELAGWDLAVDEKGKDSLVGAEYELYAWENGNKVFLIYLLTGADSVVLTQLLSKGE